MTIEIIEATSDLTIDKRAYAGCPIILRDGGLDFVPSRWLAHMWWRRSHDTVRSYARQFSSFLKYLEQRDLKWWDVYAEDIEAYQTRMHLAGYKPSSINLTLQSILSFYNWAKSRGFLEKAPFVIQSTTRASNQNVSIPIRPMRQIERLPKIINQDQFEHVLEVIPSKSSEVLLRTELTFECGRYMGLRRQEVAGLTCMSLSAVADNDTPMGLIHLDAATTKGGRDRDVLAPRAFLRRLHKYVTVYRADTVRRAQNRIPRYREPPNIFLTLSGAPLTREYVSSSWSTAAREAGISASFHTNRHWFATIVVAAAKRLKLADPLREAANMLGHADVRTTMIYDHSSILLESEGLIVDLLGLAWKQR